MNVNNRVINDLKAPIISAGLVSMALVAKYQQTKIYFLCARSSAG